MILPPHDPPWPRPPIPARPRARRHLPTLLAGLVLASPGFVVAQEDAPRKAPTFEELFGDTVVARGQGVEISQSELDKAFIALRSKLAARGERFNDSRRAESEALLLDRMIITQLLTNRASRTDRRLAAAEAEKIYTQAKQDAGTDENFRRQLKLSDLTPEEFNRRIFEQALAESVIERELKSTLSVSDEEIRTFYEKGTDLRVRLMEEELARMTNDPAVPESERLEFAARIAKIRESNQEQLMTPETVRVAHIFLSALDPETRQPLPKDVRDAKLKTAQELLAQAKAGADFMELVREHSEDRNLEETGGVYTMTRQDRFAPEFLAASFSLEPGQISDVVRSVLGFHVIKSLEKRPTAKQPLPEVEDRLREFLITQKLQEAMPDYFRKLKEQADVEILDERYRRILSD